MAEKKIGDETYRFEKLKAFGGIRLAARVAKFLGPAWGYIDSLFDADEGRRDSAALGMLGAIAEHMDVDELISLLKEITAYCQIKINGAYEPYRPDFHPKSELEVLKVAIFVLEVQLRDFFDAASGSRLGGVVLKSPQVSSSEPAPT